MLFADQFMKNLSLIVTQFKVIYLYLDFSCMILLTNDGRLRVSIYKQEEKYSIRW